MTPSLHVDLLLERGPEGTLDITYASEGGQARGRVPAHVVRRALARADPRRALPPPGGAVLRSKVIAWREAAAADVMDLLRHPRVPLGVAPSERLAADIVRLAPKRLVLAVHPNGETGGRILWEALESALPLTSSPGAGYWPPTRVVRVGGYAGRSEVRAARAANLYFAYLGPLRAIAPRATRWDGWACPKGLRTPNGTDPRALADLSLPDDSANILHIFFHGAVRDGQFEYRGPEDRIRNLREMLRELPDRERISLLVIEACHAAAGLGGAGDAVHGLASIGVPAVLGPAWEIECDEGAIFAKSLYVELAEKERDLIEAVAAAREKLEDYGVNSTKILPRLAFATAAGAGASSRLVDSQLPAPVLKPRLPREREWERLAEKFRRPRGLSGVVVPIYGATRVGARALLADMRARRPGTPPPTVIELSPGIQPAAAIEQVRMALSQGGPVIVNWGVRDPGLLRELPDVEVHPHEIEGPTPDEIEAALCGLEPDPAQRRALANEVARSSAPLLVLEVCAAELRRLAPGADKRCADQSGWVLRTFVEHARRVVPSAEGAIRRVLVTLAIGARQGRAGTTLVALRPEDPELAGAIDSLSERGLVVSRLGPDGAVNVAFARQGLERAWCELNQWVAEDTGLRALHDVRPRASDSAPELGQVWVAACQPEGARDRQARARFSDIVAELRRHCLRRSHPWLDALTLLEQPSGAVLVHPATAAVAVPDGLLLGVRFLDERARALGLGGLRAGYGRGNARSWINPLGVPDLVGEAMIHASSAREVARPRVRLGASHGTPTLHGVGRLDVDAACLLDYLPHVAVAKVFDAVRMAVVTVAFEPGLGASEKLACLESLQRVARNHVPALLRCDEGRGADSRPTDVSSRLSLEAYSDGWQLLVALGPDEGEPGEGGVEPGRLGRWLVAAAWEIELRSLPVRVSVSWGQVTRIRVADEHRADRRWLFFSMVNLRSRVLALSGQPTVALGGPPLHVTPGHRSRLFGWAPEGMRDRWQDLRKALRLSLAEAVGSRDLRPFRALTFDRAPVPFPWNPPGPPAERSGGVPERTRRSILLLDAEHREAIVFPLHLAQYVGTGHATVEGAWIVAMTTALLASLGPLAWYQALGGLSITVIGATLFGWSFESMFGRFVTTRLLPVTGPVVTVEHRQAVDLARVAISIAIEEPRIARAMTGASWGARARSGADAARATVRLIESEAGLTGLLLWFLYLGRLNLRAGWAESHGVPQSAGGLPPALAPRRGARGFALDACSVALASAVALARQPPAGRRDPTALRRAVGQDLPLVAASACLCGVVLYFCVSLGIFAAWASPLGTVFGSTLEPARAALGVITVATLSVVENWAFYLRIRMVSFATVSGRRGSPREDARGVNLEPKFRGVYLAMAAAAVCCFGGVSALMFDATWGGKTLSADGTPTLSAPTVAWVASTVAVAMAAWAWRLSYYPDALVRGQLVRSLERLGGLPGKGGSSPAVAWAGLLDPSRLGTTPTAVRALLLRAGVLSQALEIATRVLCDHGPDSSEGEALGAPRDKLREAGIFVADQWGHAHFVGGAAAFDLGYEPGEVPDSVGELYFEGQPFARTVNRLLAHARPGQIIELTALGRHRNGKPRGVYRLYVQQVRPLASSSLRGSIGVAVPMHDVGGRVASTERGRG